MHLMRIILAIAVLLPATAAAPSTSPPTDELRVMAWNIWHGGEEDGEDVGPKRVIDVIESSGAQIVAIQETYGSGERIAEALGYRFHARGTNVSILSEFPVVEDISVHEEFKCVGGLVELPDASRVAFYSIWLPFDGEIWEQGTRDTSALESMLAVCAPSAEDLREIHAAIEERLSDPEYADVPIVIAGDFNSMSHLDYGEVGYDEYGVALEWETSRVLMDAGFNDAYRETNPVIDRGADSTWTPRFPDQEQDRIDYVYYRANEWRAVRSEVIRSHEHGFPSDHAAVAATFERTSPKDAVSEVPIRAVSYNIKHGHGMDGEVDIDRTAEVLAQLDADVIALQEVDLGVRRSGGVHQVEALAEALDMHPAFGSFMEYGGGLYGLAMLSRHPIVRVESVRLPDGNEPRVGLGIRVRAPNGQEFTAVDIHFDWVRDDGYRWVQANRIAAYLETIDTPWILLGDFNDRPGSRTIRLFREAATELPKPQGARSTFPSDEPRSEIDFIFRSNAPENPSESTWESGTAWVVEEAVASDHRPVAADLVLKR